MEILTPGKLVELMEYMMENPDASETDIYIAGFGYILRFLCNGDPEHARRWCRRFTEALCRPTDNWWSRSRSW